ncbi:MAG: hypothetical protein B6247_20995 [Candidatus Parabeggiatoa sp. nov. 2]|nr:MAG: hypothetical protein B6247_20995 [Beggiatoa sp. 4572_84]
MDIYIFNELSTTPFANIYEAKEGLKTFIQTCTKAREFGFQTLRLHENIGNLYQLQIAPNYLVSQWLKDSDVEDDLKDSFRDIVFYSPLINDDDPIAKERNSLSEFKIKVGDEVKLADGLGVAYLLETLCVSFLSQDLWDSDEIKNIEHWFLKEDGSETTKTIAVRHASRQEHLDKHKTWFEKKKRERLQKSRDLWEKRAEFFPHLVLCGEVEKQLTRLGIQSKYLDQIIEKLKRLNQYATDWTEGSYSEPKLTQYGLNVSGESDSTLRKYGQLRKFRLPNRERKLFAQHIKTGDLRFHFYPDTIKFK